MKGWFRGKSSLSMVLNSIVISSMILIQSSNNVDLKRWGFLFSQMPMVAIKLRIWEASIKLKELLKYVFDNNFIPLCW